MIKAKRIFKRFQIWAHKPWDMLKWRKGRVKFYSLRTYKYRFSSSFSCNWSVHCGIMNCICCYFSINIYDLLNVDGNFLNNIGKKIQLLNHVALKILVRLFPEFYSEFYRFDDDCHEYGPLTLQIFLWPHLILDWRVIQVRCVCCKNKYKRYLAGWCLTKHPIGSI